MNNKKIKLIFLVLITVIVLGVLGIWLYLKCQNNSDIPNDYIAIFHGGVGEQTYETYIYKIDNGHANMGFKYINVTSTTPRDTSRGATASYNNTRVTGSVSNDRLNNIYDVLGNSYEWTQEEGSSFCRVLRNGNGTKTPSSRTNGRISYPTNTDGYNGSRLTLYVE